MNSSNYFVRIVKMEFQPSKVPLFLHNFEAVKEKIRHSKGCQLLEMYQAKNNPNIFFTYSYWNTEKDLNNYRNSKLFKNVWLKTKPLFSEKAQAWSLNKLYEL